MSRALLFAIALVAPTARSSAQDARSAVADSLIADARDRARAGDTATALRELARATKVAPRYARAHYERGVLLSRSAQLGLGDVLLRRAAANAIKDALDLDPGNPLYLMELGRLRLKTPLFRMEAERLFRRALDAAERRKDASVLAEVH